MVTVTAHPATDWNALDGRAANRVLVNLRQRIFRAPRQDAWKKVRARHKLMRRSYSNMLVSVRRVTQVNQGRTTPRVDTLVVKTPERRAWLGAHLMTFPPWPAKPTRRVYSTYPRPAARCARAASQRWSSAPSRRASRTPARRSGKHGARGIAPGSDQGGVATTPSRWSCAPAREKENAQ